MLCGFGDEKFSGSPCLMDCSPSSSDKKTLKRWFFIDKREDHSPLASIVGKSQGSLTKSARVDGWMP